MKITCDMCLSTLDNALLVPHLMGQHYLAERLARREARRIRAEALRARQHAAKLLTVIDEALDLFAQEHCHRDGTPKTNVGGAWVKQARAVIAEVRDPAAKK